MAMSTDLRRGGGVFVQWQRDDEIQRVCAKRRYGQRRGHGDAVHCIGWSGQDGVCEDV